MPNTDFIFANADSITDYLAVGGDLDEHTELALKQAAELADHAHITHVLDVRLEAKEDLWTQFAAVKYRWDGIDDAGQQVPARWFERVTDWAERAIQDGGTVYAHCHMGINRGPSAGFAILLRHGWDPIDAIDAIRAARPQAFVAYAEDALSWHLARTHTNSSDRLAADDRLAAWRRANPMDVGRAIRNGGHDEGGWAA